jgi:hypothetical protein
MPASAQARNVKITGFGAKSAPSGHRHHSEAALKAAAEVINNAGGATGDGSTSKFDRVFDDWCIAENIGDCRLPDRCFGVGRLLSWQSPFAFRSMAMPDSDCSPHRGRAGRRTAKILERSFNVPSEFDVQVVRVDATS